MKTKLAKTYAIYGALFGLCFPIISTLLDAGLSSGDLSPGGLLAQQASNPLLLVIDTAPFFLGLFASFAGRRQDLVESMLRQVRDASDEVRKANESLQGKNEELVAMSKHKSQFLASMSHELRTPLNAIIGFSRILIRKTKDVLPERQARNLKMINESGQHLLAMVNDLLDIERIEAGMFTLHEGPVDLPAMASDVVDKARPMARERELQLEVEIDLPAPATTVTTDSVRLRQVLDNLITNALKYSEKGSVRVRCYQEGENFVLAVQDEGIGISEEHLPHIFEAFRQVDDGTAAVGGVGLGLHMVKRLVEKLGCDIKAESEFGKGSVFKVLIPVAMAIGSGATDDGENPEIIECSESDDGSQTGPLVLVVDDRQGSRELMCSDLRYSGYRVAEASSGREGLTKAMELRPAAIVLDIIMPETDGWAVLRELRSTADISSTPVIVTSMLNDAPMAYDLGVLSWLTKPILEDELRKTLANLGIFSDSNILIVEDDAATREMTLEHLEELGVPAKAVANGEDAVESLLNNLPGCVILDLTLPEMSGFDVLAKLREMPGGNSIPVIIYTAMDLDDEKRKLLSGDLVEIIGKGASGSLQSVVTCVRSALAEESPDE